ncbi:MAG: hypothetical protein AAFQ94_00560 [Bacteroidota bacterium]
MKMLREILTGGLLLTAILLMSCNEGEIANLSFQEDFFCGEDKPEVFFSFEIDGEDIFIDEGTVVDLDMCNLSNEISGIRAFDIVFTDENIMFFGTRVHIVSRDYNISLDLLGLFYAHELNFQDERAHGNEILNGDFQYLKFGGETEFLNDDMEVEIPNERTSYTSIEVLAKTDGQDINYLSEAPIISRVFPYFPEVFQQGSFMKIDSIEEIDYINPDFPEVTYNYIITGSFECRLYRERSEEQFLDVKNGKFRIPVRFEIPPRLF